jgi:hypothetical protein
MKPDERGIRAARFCVNADGAMTQVAICINAAKSLLVSCLLDDAFQETFREVAKALETKFGEARKAALTWKPQNTVPVDDETGEKLLKLIDLLNEHDDVQNVFANFEVSDALMARLGG